MEVADLVNTEKPENPQWDSAERPLTRSSTALKKKLLREPLVHFLILGALLFAAYKWTGSGGPGSSQIVITRADRGSGCRLRAQLAKTRQRGRAQGTHR